MKPWIPLFLLVFCLPLAAEENTAARVEALITHTRNSEVVFIRNGKEHSPEEAAEHLQKKYEHFRKKGKIKSPEDFIKHAGTQSLISGKPYKIRLPDGTEVNSSDWLLDRLASIRNAEGAETP